MDKVKISDQQVDLTPVLNEHSIEFVRDMIQRKNGSSPFYTTIDSVKNVITDYDHFPYTRYFRGVATYPEPIVAEREAGYRTVQNQCYEVNAVVPKQKVDYCFQYPCSTIRPCNPNKRKEKNEWFDNECIVQYR